MGLACLSALSLHVDLALAVKTVATVAQEDLLRDPRVPLDVCDLVPDVLQLTTACSRPLTPLGTAVLCHDF